KRLDLHDDPLTFADPRTGTTRAGLREQLDQAGRELLGSESVRYFARGEDEPGAPAAGPLDPSLAADALKHHGMLFYCPDTERSASLVQAARAARTRSLVAVAVTGSEGQPLGLLEVHHGEPDPYRPAGLARVALLAGRAHRVNVTASAGVAMFPDHADNAQDLWRLANQALLQAKRPPKNRVVFHRPKGERGFGTK